MIYKRCGRCGARIPAGSKCKCKRVYGKAEGTRKLYHTGRWQRLRDVVLHMYSGIDPYALAQGRLESAEVVHHIIPAGQQPEKFFDIGNLIPLSRASHDEVHKKYKDDIEGMQEYLRKLQDGREGMGIDEGAPRGV